MGAAASVVNNDIKDDVAKPVDASDLQEDELRGEVQRLRTSLRKVADVASAHTFVSNDEPISSPKQPTLMDNCLLFLPPSAVVELGLEVIR